MKKIILYIAFALTIIQSSGFSSDVVWADKLIGFSSQVSSKEYGAIQVLGKPNVLPNFGETPCAWSPVIPTNRIEWIKVGFDNPIYAEAIVINENLNPGAVVKIVGYDSLSRGYSIYRSNQIPISGKPGKTTILQIEKTNFRIYSLKVELSLNNYLDKYQIESIGLMPKYKDFEVKVNQETDSDVNNIPENLGKRVNSEYSELAPLISADGKKLYFTRNYHPENLGNLNKQDIWYSTQDENGIFSEAKNIGEPLNDASSNFAVSTSSDGNLLIVGNVYKEDGTKENGFSISEFTGDEWTFPEKINIREYYNLSNTGSYNLSSNQKILLLAIERRDSKGGTDIYISERIDDNLWSEPKSLGNTINTAASEDSPFLASDGKTLYFSSSGFPGYGSNDMFMTKRLDDTWTNWSEPKNLGPGINTPGWDAYYTITADGKYAYFVTNKNTIGQNDIFKVALTDEIQPESVVVISGRVLNSKDNSPLKADIIYEVLPSGEEVGIAKSNSKTGEYTIILPAGKKYGFLAKADGYVSINENMDLRIQTEFAEIEKDLLLVPIEKGQTVRINNIFFEFGKYELLEDSYSELNRLVNLMQKNPSMKIEIIGHTDNVGSAEDNLILSKNRAGSVSDYLKSKGISNTRIFTKGMGMTNPVSSNDTEQGRKRNRRVEFKIIAK